MRRPAIYALIALMMALFFSDFRLEIENLEQLYRLETFQTSVTYPAPCEKDLPYTSGLITVSKETIYLYKDHKGLVFIYFEISNIYGQEHGYYFLPQNEIYVIIPDKDDSKGITIWMTDGVKIHFGDGKKIQNLIKLGVISQTKFNPVRKKRTGFFYLLLR
jgi:hypothetical protein